MRSFVAILCVALTYAFITHKSQTALKSTLYMKWQFGKGAGSMQDVGGIGSQGEYYYIPSKKPNLKAPTEALGKEKTIPIFPRNQVLGPLGEEYVGIYEMRYRQLLNDVGEDGVFGNLYYSQENSKLALVGTLCKVKKAERLDDGGVYVVMEGVGRFYIREVVTEKPYLRAKVQIFHDYVENDSTLASLEQVVLNEVRYSVKIMKLLYPQNNYSINELVLRYMPPQMQSTSVRNVALTDANTELDRSSKFSFAVVAMLKTDPATKLAFLQEPILEKRYSKILKVLQESTAFLEGELSKRGIITDTPGGISGAAKLRADSMTDTSDLVQGEAQTVWSPINYVDNEWVMAPTIF